MSDDGRSWSARGLPPELDPRKPKGRRVAGPGGHPITPAAPARGSQGRNRGHNRGRSQGGSRGRTALKVLTYGTAALMLVVGIGGYGLYRHFDGNLTRSNVFGLLSDRPAKVAGGALNLLLVGSDSRDGADAEYQATGNDAKVEGARSDTTILAHISADRQHVVMMSLPRDLLVPIPVCTDPATGQQYRAKTSGQFNSAFSEGGAPCTIATVEQLTGIRIDHYVEVDFTGFTRMVDALDGVPICLTEPIKDTNDTVDLQAGSQTLDGAQALGFVRARYGVGDGSDLSRIDRQKQFLGAMVRRATSAGIVLRPDRLLPFLDAATKSLKVDAGLSVGDMKTIAQSLGGLDPERVAFVTAPIDPDPGPDFAAGGRYSGRVKLDAGKADELFTALRTDSGLPGAQVAPTGPLTVAPSDVVVDVQNAGGRQGAASDTGRALRGAGFQTSSVGNAPSGTADKTVVRYGNGQADAAATLAAALGVEAKADGNLGGAVVLIVGTDFPSTLTPVEVTPAAPAPTSADTGVDVPTTTAADTACG